MEFNAMMSDWNSDVLRGLTNKLQKITDENSWA
jgi:hypothetical protein